MRPRSRFTLLALVLAALNTSACTHTGAAPVYTPLYRFPEAFFVEQTLTVKGPEGTARMVGQLEKNGKALKLVLTDSMTGLVLTKVDLSLGEVPKVLYLAPVLSGKNFPGEQISFAIQYLYAQTEVALNSGAYTVVDPENRWTYTWDTLRRKASCLFPEVIQLTFKDLSYSIVITLKEFDCVTGAKP